MEQNRVLFGSCKGETHTPQSGFKQLYRRLRAHFKPEKQSSKEDTITREMLSGVSIFVLGCPTEKFSKSECEAIRSFIGNGGSLLVCMSGKKANSNATNINYILEEFGVVVNSDSVVRTVHHRYMHPKEVLITDGILNREIYEEIFRNSQFAQMPLDNFNGRSMQERKEYMDDPAYKLDIVYPHGATLSVQKPAVALLSSGKIAYPMNRPVVAGWSLPGSGKVVVAGSVEMFDDNWVDKESNAQLMEFLFDYMRTDSNIQLNYIDADEPDLNDYEHIPDVGSLSARPKSCLQDVGEELPRDFKEIFDESLSLTDDLVTEAVSLFDKLQIKKGPLTLIPPKFEVPLPSLQPAVFPPAFREPAPPALELFDLDDHFASPQSSLAQLFHKCNEGSEEDVSCFIVEGARALGIPESQALSVTNSASAKAMLAEIFRRTVHYKMSDAHADAPYAHSPVNSENGSANFQSM
mmetsp:Transcript_9966/g.25382  ORF Transcript_9966/g.25382 Transcript_9966/m.25382 type:complete len:465 (+) Transcript_9966:160-1554(+)|eukprot:CAMPEP_0198243956 /NCGR_PEP_ID=MMETSP1446-20131203/32076_1 /TAXON_ID=1461542 ORGANISM="Unidentified sp, Strain CCMP2111" /NCGR_SAMPLE_ID=MMETSP1446 /ASSEMBLY_ACC=CAM_ASM_001112 /LENGTH=464 /DNA_ID=CAMNT_0043927911 /DNA_START=139 /DNA_END=1533 /DNA_ORIENTATION=-